MEIKLAMQPDGNWRIDYDPDRPVATIAALEAAVAAVKQQAAQREMQPAVAVAGGDLARRLLNGRG